MEKLGFKVLCGFDVINKDFIRGAVKPQIAKFLEAAKAKVKPEIMERMQGVTGVVGILETGRPGPTVGFRCELDCVPVTETSDPEHIPNKKSGLHARLRPRRSPSCFDGPGKLACRQ